MKNPIWVRIFFLLVVVQALSIGRSLLWPELISANLPWPASPLNARFVAALYWMGAITALLSMFAARYAEVRIGVIEIGVLTGTLLLLTLPHLGEFTPETFPTRWIVLYTLDPLAAGAIVWFMRRADPPPPGRNQFAPFFLAYAILLVIIGAALLVAPAFVAQLWPWNLPPILGQVYSIFFLTFALGGWLAARDPRWEAAWIYVVANLTMLVLVLIVSVVHADRFKAGLSSWLWYGAWLGIALAFAAILVNGRRLAARGVAV